MIAYSKIYQHKQNCNQSRQQIMLKVLIWSRGSKNDKVSFCLTVQQVSHNKQLQTFTNLLRQLPISLIVLKEFKATIIVKNRVKQIYTKGTQVRQRISVNLWLLQSNSHSTTLVLRKSFLTQRKCRKLCHKIHWNVQIKRRLNKKGKLNRMKVVKKIVILDSTNWFNKLKIFQRSIEAIHQQNKTL